jgi:hypothetical protein
MANVYFRVPHYVASYLRNRDRENPVEVGGVINLNPSEKLWYQFMEGLYPNVNLTISRSYCFCQRQWRRMVDGYSLDTFNGGKRHKVLKDAEGRTMLDDSEIHRLAGLPVPRNADSSEYICIAMPREAMRHGCVVPTNACWQLRDTSVNSVRAMLVDEFWRTLFCYVDKAIDRCKSAGRNFVLIDTLESFMERYNIKSSADAHERNALKRNYNRRRKSYRFSTEDYIEYG